ncbi:MAG: DUF4386 domain-containing protein, partial [Chloroflexi bacterium]|nr:DUF4386 domain-containing protein [Chloroflexota bacterium]
LGVLDGAGFFNADVPPAQRVAILADHQAVASLAILGFVLWGFLQVVLTLALYERLKGGSPGMAQTATAIGLILATLYIAAYMVTFVGIEKVVELHGHDPEQAGALYLALESVELGITENENITGLWVLLVSWTALRVRQLPRALNYIGIVAGVAGLLTLAPALDALVAVFGLAQIIWYVWLGVVMLRGSAKRESRTLAGEAA